MTPLDRTFDQLEKLLASKSYSELTPRERDLVLQHFDSSEEYEAMRLGLPGVTDAVQADEPEISVDPGQLQRLVNRLELNEAPEKSSRRPAAGGMMSFFPFELTSIKAGLVSVAILGLFWVSYHPPQASDAYYVDTLGVDLPALPPSYDDSNNLQLDSFYLN